MRWAIVLVTLGAFAPSRAAAQQVDSTPRLGLGASSALTAHVGVRLGYTLLFNGLP